MIFAPCPLTDVGGFEVCAYSIPLQDLPDPRNLACVSQPVAFSISSRA